VEITNVALILICVGGFFFVTHDVLTIQNTHRERAYNTLKVYSSLH